MSGKLLPQGEASRLLGIHNVTLKKWIYSGRMRAVKTPAGRWMIPKSEAGIIGGKVETYSRIQEAPRRG